MKLNNSVDFDRSADHSGAMSAEDRFAELRRRHTQAELGGGEERIRRQHKAGKDAMREEMKKGPTPPRG